MTFTVVTVVMLLAAAPAAATKAEVTPIQKVLEMMGGMLAKGQEEKHTEEVEFAKYHEWCDTVRMEKTRSIAEAKAQIEELAAAIDKAEADAEALSLEISELEERIAKFTADADAAKKVRTKEHEDYAAVHMDYSESIDALERAIQVLKTKDHDIPQSLLQLSKMARIPERERTMIASFLSLNSDASSEVGAPEADAYDFQSGGIIVVLKKLLLKFEDERFVIEKAEMNSRNSYEVLMQQLTDDIKADTESKNKKTALKSKRLEQAAKAKADKEVTEASKAEDEKILTDTLAECKLTSDEYEKNQVVRAGEIKALTEAIKIISSEEVSGSAKEYLPSNLLQTKQSALAMLRSATSPDDNIRQRVVDLLQNRAKTLGSKQLALVAIRVSEDPFIKVKKMIKDLIVKLMESANAEADEHAYCETELATNKQTREIKSSEVEELTAELESQNALLEKLTTEIAELSDEVAELKSQQKSATDIRMEQKKTNTVTIEDAKVAQDAVEKAISILREFYASVAAGSALVQGATGLKQQMNQAASDSLDPYKGMQATKGGILGMLEVILSDFARLETETQQAENVAQTEYEKFMDESNEDIAVKDTETKHKSGRKDTCVATISDLEKNLKLTQSELDKAMDYYAKLKARCLDTGFSYAERKRMREEEIQSLKEAYAVLSGEDLAF